MAVSQSVIKRPRSIASSLVLFAVFIGCGGEKLQPNNQLPMVGEICDDGIDNDNNGLIDCAESSCSQQPSCQDVAPAKPSIEPSWPACASIDGDRSTTPVDIIWVVDSSPSMVEEMGWIQQNLSDFVSYLTGIKLDVRVILLGGDEICAPAPLSGPNCADGPKYRHINDYVGSHDSLKKLIEFYPRYSDFLRSGRKALIVTSDDNSDVSAEWFTEQIQGLAGPGFGEDYVFHSIVAYGTHPRGCFTGAAPGRVYLKLTEDTNGIKYPVCESDWKRIFAELANGVVGMIDLPCAYKVPAMPEGKAFIESQIHVTYSNGTERLLLPRLAGAAGCDQQLGWFFDSTAQTVRLCPGVCNNVAVAEVEIAFGCSGSVN